MEKNKRRKRAIIIAALIAIPGLLIAGVFASNTSITLNNGTPLSLGAGYTTATSCDNAVDVNATQNFNATDSVFKVEEIKISNIAENSGACAEKVLTVVLVSTNGTTNTATWSIASTSANTNTYIFGQTTTNSGTNKYANKTLGAFALNVLATIAVGIS